WALALFFCGWSVLRFHREADPVSLFIHFSNRYHHLLLYLNQLIGVFYVTISQLAEVHQSVLMYADIHEGTEVGDICHDTRQPHANTEVGNGVYTFGKRKRLELLPRIPSGFSQLGQNVAEGRHSYVFADIFFEVNLFAQLFVLEQV